MDVGIVLEGGGARGAYHMGALKAIYEHNYNIIAITGTSIGAINGAMVAQGNFEEAYKIWETIQYTTLFDVNEEKLTAALKKYINFDIVKYLSKKFTDTVKNGGIGTEKMRDFMDKYIDEDKLRASNTRFGLVTFSITDKKPLELFLEDIPKGLLKNYIMASGQLPVFKQEATDGKLYMDGGIYNNCPINMLADNGYKNIIAIRTGSIFRAKDIKRIQKIKDMNLLLVEPKNNLPNILAFDSITSNKLLKLGYYDAMKKLDKLDGFEYYINNIDEEIYFESLFNYDNDNLNKIYISLSLVNRDTKKTLFETVIPTLMKKIGIKEVKTYKEVIVSLIEYVAEKENIEKFKIYDIIELLQICKSKVVLKGKNKLDEIIYRFIKGLEIKK
ncbi:MAG: patatin-like phospholipase family protein [Clostridia bacterium]